MSDSEIIKIRLDRIVITLNKLLETFASLERGIIKSKGLSEKQKNHGVQMISDTTYKALDRLEIQLNDAIDGVEWADKLWLKIHK